MDWSVSMKLQYENIILRDAEEKDLEDYIRWNTTETEWQNWDAPWDADECIPFSEQVSIVKKLVNGYIASAQNNKIRKRFEICTEDGIHIGWINRYYIDENYSWTRADANVAIGIDIPSVDLRGHGYGENAFKCFMQYLFDNNIDIIYTQTWSGNERMMRLAKKLGFKECNRKIGIRTVDEKQYDSVTFCVKCT